ncbi:hypothetical protein [Streptomyces sp. SCL15-4]|uniref:hypothetical protein n=1 Tax=Streptomyces sp. SCL15-4 TaxID=2967221 RepID=UPI002966C0F7|nr:hypothetical protein [Streptomyces sp. SCL15-4]
MTVPLPMLQQGAIGLRPDSQTRWSSIWAMPAPVIPASEQRWEASRALSRGEFYTEKIEAHEHMDFQGPAAEEAAARLQGFGARARFQGQLAPSKNRLLRIVKRHAAGVYPGTYMTCVHDPAKALCEKARRDRGENLPEYGGCLPLACRNAWP